MIFGQNINQRTYNFYITHKLLNMRSTNLRIVVSEYYPLFIENNYSSKNSKLVCHKTLL